MLPQTEMLQPTAVCAVAIVASAVTVAEEDVAEIFTCNLGLDVANLTAIVWLVTEHQGCHYSKVSNCASE